MAGRSHPTFKKRQKELARKEKQRSKAERKAQRKLERLAGTPSPDLNLAAQAVESEPFTNPAPDPTEQEPLAGGNPPAES